jgi:hypothetical protein
MVAGRIEGERGGSGRGDGGHVSGLGRWAVSRSSTVVMSATSGAVEEFDGGHVRTSGAVEEFDRRHVSDLGR